MNDFFPEIQSPSFALAQLGIKSQSQLQNQHKKTSKKITIRRILKHRKQSIESEVSSLQNDIDSTGNGSDSSIPERRKTKRVTFADEIESCELSSPSKASTKDSQQKLTVEKLPAISIPYSENPSEIKRSRRSRIQVRSDQGFTTRLNAEEKNDIYQRHYDTVNNFEKKYADFCAFKLPIIRSPRRVVQTVPGDPYSAKYYREESAPQISNLIKVNLLSPISERKRSNNPVFNDYELMRRDFANQGEKMFMSSRQRSDFLEMGNNLIKPCFLGIKK